MKKLPVPRKIPKPRSLPTKHRDKPKPPSTVQGRAGSNVTSHSYNPETGQLTVTFHGGRSYQYDHVDPKIAADFRDSGQQGTFLHNHIIGQHPTKRIDP